MAIPPCGNSDNQCSDHPLSDGPESAWSTFFKDNEFLLQIDKDVRRLCPDISFFQQVSEDQPEAALRLRESEILFFVYHRRLNFQMLISLTAEV